MNYPQTSGRLCQWCQLTPAEERLPGELGPKSTCSCSPEGHREGTTKLLDVLQWLCWSPAAALGSVRAHLTRHLWSFCQISHWQQCQRSQGGRPGRAWAPKPSPTSHIPLQQFYTSAFQGQRLTLTHPQIWAFIFSFCPFYQTMMWQQGRLQKPGRSPTQFPLPGS